MLRNLASIVLLAMSLAMFVAAPAQAEDDDAPRVMSAQEYAAAAGIPPTFSEGPEAHHDSLPSLRDAIVPKNENVERTHFEGMLPLPPGSTNQPDGAIQRMAAPTLMAPSVLTSFEGVGKDFSGPQGTFSVGSAPPDTDGAVGLTQYVSLVNTSFAVLDKTTGNAIYGPVPTNTLWSGFGGGCETNNDGDGVVIYDRTAGRWVISQFAVSSTPYLECVAVSKTSDATGGWNRYSFSYGNSDFADYPKMGAWPDGYYVTFNIFAGGSSFSGAKLCAYDRTKMLAGNAATQQCFQLSTAYGGVLPSDLDGATAPPAGSPNYMLNYDTNSLNLWKFHVDWTTPANSSLSGPTSLSVPSFSPLCNGGTCVTQPGTTSKLDSLADRMMFRVAYRNLGSHEALVASHSVTAGSKGGVRWYEIRDPGGTPTVYQASTFAPDTTAYRWMPSIAMDQSGDIAIGYSVSTKTSPTIKPSLRYTGRTPADALNTMQTEVNVLTGGGVQTGTLHRWGDYSAMTVDPVDDCTFWFTSEYIPSNGTFNWSTRIASFKFATCGAVPTYTISGSVGGLTGANTVGLTLNDTTTSSSQVLGAQANGGFTFPTALTSGDDWNVVVSAQPAGQTCGITNASGTNLSANVTNVTVTCTSNTYTITGTASPVAGGTVTCTPSSVGYNGSSSCTATANPGYTFSAFSGDCTGATCSLTNIQSNKNVTATFTANTYTITGTASPVAGGTVTCTPSSVGYNGSSTCTVTANPGYAFSAFSGDCTGTTCSLTNIQSNKNVTATFTIDTFTLTYTAGANGTISGTSPQTVNYGASGTPVTATAATGYHFVQWSDGVLTATRTDTNVQANISVTASFAIDTFTLTYTAGANGNIAGTSPQTVNYGASGTPVTATPATGYHFVQWSDGSTANPRTDTNVQANISVTASFAIDTFTLTYTAGANGTISGTSPQTVNYGASGSAVSANPATGYHFVQWGDGVLTATRTDTNVTADITVTASFAANPPAQLVLSVVPDGIAGAALTPAVTVTVEDANGNPVVGDVNSVTLSIASGPGSFDAASTVTSSFVNGVATFGNLILDTAGDYTLAAMDSADALAAGPGNTFTISAAAASSLVFSAQPADVLQGTTQGTIAVTEQDPFGNVITTDSASTVSFTVDACSAPVSLGSAQMAGGVATLSASMQRFYSVGTGLTVKAASAGNFAGNVTSSAFDVNTNGDIVFGDGFDGCRL